MDKMPIPSEAEPEPEPPQGIVFASVLRDLVANWKAESERVAAMAAQQRSKELEHVGKTIGRAASQLEGLVDLAAPCVLLDDGDEASISTAGWPVPMPAEAAE